MNKWTSLNFSSWRAFMGAALPVIHPIVPKPKISTECKWTRSQRGRIMRLSCPVSFTHVCPLICWWLWRGSVVGDLRHSQLAECLAEVWSGISVFRVGVGVSGCHLFPRRRTRRSALECKGMLQWRHCGVSLQLWFVSDGFEFSCLLFDSTIISS